MYEENETKYTMDQKYDSQYVKDLLTEERHVTLGNWNETNLLTMTLQQKI